MRLPTRIPGLRWLAAVVGLYAFVWLSLEGAVGQVMLLAVGLTVVGAGYLIQRLMGGREMTSGQWLLFSGALGAAMGLACGLLTLGLMAVKTGLHGHGPEFSAAEIEWVVSQLPLWTAAGALAGLGLGLVLLNTIRR